ncbi:MAG: tripartite tricarboxylate transporter TctB family protein [Burkholderiaceae bacterium]
MADQNLFESGELTPAETRAVASSDLRGAFCWGAFGVAVLVGSITMDRLERQDINPYTIPGLLPGLLGIVIIVLAVLLGLRSWRRGGAVRNWPAIDAAMVRRLGLVIGLILVYSVVLVGHGMPFWLASTLYVAGSIVTLQHAHMVALGQKLAWRDVIFALAVGLGTGWLITYVFQDLFLVRLP